MMKEKHINLEFINLLYIIGALFVVLGHSTANYLGNWGAVNLVDSKAMILIHDYIYTFHMPLFFFISGFIFKYNLNLGKYRIFYSFILGKVKRLLIPYLLVGIFYVSPMKLIIGDYTLNNYWFQSGVNILIGISPSQLWYLLALFNIFIIYYVIKSKLDSFSDNWKSNMILLIVCVFLKLFISTGFTFFSDRSNT